MGECASSRDEKDELKSERARAQRRMMIDRGLEFDFSFRQREECISYTSFLHFFLLFLSLLIPYSVSPPEKANVEFSDYA